MHYISTPFIVNSKNDIPHINEESSILIEKTDKIYIAGHKGLVGSAIQKSLADKGYSNLIGKSHAELDLEDQQVVKEFFDKEHPDIVVLAAAHVGGIMANNSYRADFIMKNMKIQCNVISEAYSHNVKKLLFLGSTCIYPKNAEQPIKESSLLTSELEYTNEPYAIAKIAGLKMCESYNIQYGTNYIAVMPTNLYGPNDNFNLETSHVLPAMVRKMHLAKLLKNNDFESIKKDFERNNESYEEGILSKYGIFPERLELWGSGKPMREFLWSEDMADACVFLLETLDMDCQGKEIRNCHINIGTGKEISIKDLAYLVKGIVGYDGEIVFDISKPDGTMKKLTDVSKIHSLGWSHSIELEDGINKLYDWYLKNN